MLRLTHLDSSKVIWMIGKVSLTPLLGTNLLSTIFLWKKSIEIVFCRFWVFFEIIKDEEMFGVTDIVDDQ